MTRQAFVKALAVLTVALVVPLAAGCSSPGGCRTCRKESLAPAATPSPTAAAPTVGPPGGSAPADRPYGGQKTCPVTGEGLGSMGRPVAVTVKGRTVYVCCRGCAANAQADPDKTLAAVAAEQAQR